MKGSTTFCGTRIDPKKKGNISEIDELMQVNKKIESNTKNLEKRLKNIETSIVQYHNIQDTFINTIVNGYKEKD